MNNKKRRKKHNYSNSEKICFMRSPSVNQYIGVIRNFRYHVHYGRPCTARCHDPQTLNYKNRISYMRKLDDFWINFEDNC